MERAFDPGQVEVVLRAAYDERSETQSELEELLRDALYVMPPREANSFLRSVRRALKSAHQAEVPASVREFVDGIVDVDEHADPTLTAELVTQGVALDFARRNAVVDNAYTAPQAANELRISRQAVTDRWKKGKLCGFMANDALRLPTWQFDAGQPDGVVAGLPRVLAALERSGLSPLNRIYWLTTPQPALGDLTPVASLREGRVDDVVSQAAGAGVW
jgi:hypothetical protein